MPLDLDRVREAMSDELRKIAEVRTEGLSPETLLSLRSPAPLETAGLSRAREILLRAEMPKVANIPSIEEEAAQDRRINEGRALGKKMLTGAGVGRILSEVSLKTTGSISPIRRTAGTAIGAAGGLIDHLAEQRYQRRKAARDVLRREAGVEPVKLSSAVHDPSYRLKKSQKAFSARDALTAVRNETVVPRKP